MLAPDWVLKENSIRHLKSGVNYDEILKYFSIPMFFICWHLRVVEYFDHMGGKIKTAQLLAFSLISEY
jgi:hypothetical protein